MQGLGGGGRHALAPGVAAKMFRTLAEEGIDVQMITTSEIRISVAMRRSTSSARCAPCTRPMAWMWPLDKMRSINV